MQDDIERVKQMLGGYNHDPEHAALYKALCETIADAERYTWLREHYASANFEPEGGDGMELIFAVQQGRVSGNCDKTIDALMEGANN